MTKPTKARADWTHEEYDRFIKQGAKLLLAGTEPKHRHRYSFFHQVMDQAFSDKSRLKVRSAFSGEKGDDYLKQMRILADKMKAEAIPPLVDPTKPSPVVITKPEPPEAKVEEQLAHEEPPKQELPVESAEEPVGNRLPSLPFQLGQAMGEFVAGLLSHPAVQEVLAQALTGAAFREAPTLPPANEPAAEPAEESPVAPVAERTEPAPQPAMPKHNPFPRPTTPAQAHVPKPRVLIAGLPSDRRPKFLRVLSAYCNVDFWTDKRSGGNDPPQRLAQLAANCEATFAITTIMSHPDMQAARDKSPSFHPHAGGDETLMKNIILWVRDEYLTKTKAVVQ